MFFVVVDILIGVVAAAFVKIHAHFPHGCGIHFTIHTYFYILAQGEKPAPRLNQTSVENTSVGRVLLGTSCLLPLQCQ